MGLRESKKEQTRIALSWATIRLTVQRGFHNVRIEDIAAEAGVSPRTFNNYFGGKAEAIAYRQVERVRQIAEELRARPADEPLWDAVTEAVLARFALRDDDGSDTGTASREHWQTGVRLMVGEPALQGELIKAGVAGEAALAAAVADRTGTDADRDAYPWLVAGAIGVVLRVATERMTRDGPPTSPEAALRDALHQMAGLATP